MPPRRTATTRPGDGNSQTNMYLGAAILRQLTTAQLQELCRRNGLSALGRRTTLENRLKNAGIVSAAVPNDPSVNRQLPLTGLPVQQRANPNAFTEEQITEIKRLVQDSVAAAARDIAREAARAATRVSQLQAPSSSQVTPSAQAVSQDTAGVAAILGPQEHQHPLQALQSLQPNDGSLTSTPCRHGAPFQEIPMNYVKEIQSGEFFDLSKLLPQNLSLHDEEDNVSLSLENSVIKVSKKTKASTSITDIEQWTNAFTTYLSVFTDKFPLRSQELLQYLSLIRYAARVHKGLGWVIYDYKFRQKASKNKSLVWSTIDSQLWLTIFTVHPGVLREEYPLFPKGPSTGSSSSANSKGSFRSGTCNIYNRSGSCTRNTCWYEHICNRCRGAHPGCDCPSLPKPREGDRDRDKDQGNSKSSSSRKYK